MQIHTSTLMTFKTSFKFYLPVTHEKCILTYINKLAAPFLRKRKTTIMG